MTDLEPTMKMAHIEQRVAAYTNWAFFGSFGFCLALSGFAGSDLLAGLAGFAIVLLGFAVHLIINQIFGTRFTSGEIALGLILFGLSMIGFIGSWLFDPNFTDVNMVIGLVGFGSIVVSFIATIFIKFGIRESYLMIHRVREH
jgi:hypothetical protein